MSKIICRNLSKMYWYGDYTDKGGEDWKFTENTERTPLKEVYKNCGKCMACRLRQAYERGLTITHEMESWKHNYFITLTVNEDNIQEVFPNRELRHEPFKKFQHDLTQFIKREARKNPENNKNTLGGAETITAPKGRRKGLDFDGLRFTMCGEYGDKLGRPHYHVIISNFDFSPWQVYRKTRTIYKDKKVIGKEKVYKNSLIERFWKWGFNEVSEANENHGAYVAKYVMKKRTSTKEDEKATRGAKRGYHIHPVTKELRKSEYVKTPQDFGNGSMYYQKNRDKMFKNGYVEFKIKKDNKKRKASIPEIYQEWCKKDKPELYYNYKKNIEAEMLKNKKAFTDDEKIKEWEEMQRIVKVQENRIEKASQREQDL